MEPTAARRKRTRAEAAAAAAADDRLASEWLCPITQELPTDPVIAQDGRCYERLAIQQWFDQRPDDATALSPVTNVAMSKDLLPCVQVKATIALLIETGQIAGERARAWLAATQQADATRALREALMGRAAAGDREAICSLGAAYRDGAYGLAKDDALAYAHLKRAADLGHVSAMCAAGQLALQERGVRHCAQQGLAMVHTAAWRGSEHACAELGKWFTRGTFGLVASNEEAARYYARMRECATRDSTEACRVRAAAFLAEADAAPDAPAAE